MLKLILTDKFADGAINFRAFGAFAQMMGDARHELRRLPPRGLDVRVTRNLLEAFGARHLLRVRRGEDGVKKAAEVFSLHGAADQCPPPLALAAFTLSNTRALGGPSTSRKPAAPLASRAKL